MTLSTKEQIVDNSTRITPPTADCRRDGTHSSFLKFSAAVLLVLLLAAFCCVGAVSAYEGTPKLLSDAELIGYNVLVVNDETGEVVTKLASDLVDNNQDVYLLEDAEDWNAAAANVDSDNAGYQTAVLILGDNLDFSKTDTDSMMGEKFTGKIYGNGYLIENFANSEGIEWNTGTANARSFGLIPLAGDGLYLNYVQMTNPNLEHSCSTLSSVDSVGLLIGHVRGKISPHGVTVIGCSVYGGKTNKGNSGGIIGIVATGSTLVVKHSNVLNLTTYTDGNYIGGLIGSIGGTVSCTIVNCTVRESWIESTGKGVVGGLFGGITTTGDPNTLSVMNCRVEDSTIKGKSYGIGGITGASYIITMDHCDVVNCYVESTNDGYVGGLIGRASCDNKPYTIVTNCNVIGCDVKSSANRIGGLFGSVENSLCSAENCNVLKSNIAGSTVEMVGGLVGGDNGVHETTATFTNCVAGTSDEPVYLSPYSPTENELKGTALTVITTDCDANIITTPFDLQFPTKEKIQFFSASKLPYVYVTYDVTDAGTLGSPYSESKKTVAMPYVRPENFDAERITPIGQNGYGLSNWFKGDTTEIRTETPVVSDERVKANWVLIEYPITYTLDGGTNAAGNPASYTITSPTITLADAAKQGYVFEGWYNASSKSLGNKNNTIPSGSTGDKEFWAKWTANVTVLNLTVDGTTFEKRSETYDVVNTTAVSPLPEKIGYDFGGWKVMGTEIKLIDGTGKIIPNVEGYTNAAGAWHNSILTTGAELTLDDVWIAHVTEVTLKNYHGIADTAVSLTYDANVPTIMPIPAKKGYTFYGWNNENDGKGTLIINNQGVFQNVQEYCKDGKWAKDVSTLTLYANWTANVYNKPVSGGVADFTNDDIPLIKVDVGTNRGITNVIFKFLGAPASDITTKPAGFKSISLINDEFDLSITGTQTGDVTVFFTADPSGHYFLAHYKNNAWEFLKAVATEVTGQYKAIVTKESGFSPFQIVSAEPEDVPQSHSSSRDTGASIWLPATAEPTAVPTEVQPTQAVPTASPVKPTPQASSPAPFIGILAGLGAAAVFFGLRRR